MREPPITSELICRTINRLNKKEAIHRTTRDLMEATTNIDIPVISKRLSITNTNSVYCRVCFSFSTIIHSNKTILFDISMVNLFKY